jgi:DNA-binding IclR family transcriptional regulator
VRWPEPLPYWNCSQRRQSRCGCLPSQQRSICRKVPCIEFSGYVEQSEVSGCYRATLRLWELGTGLITEHPIKRAAAAFLQQLHAATRETVSLAILSGDDVLYLDKIMSPRPIRFTTRVGSRVPAPLTAGGKAILAQLPNAREIIHRVRTRTPANRRVPVARLMSELAEVRERGYAISSYSNGVQSFAVPIRVRDGSPAAALSVSAPEQRLNDKKQAQIIESLLVISAEIAERVGPL